MNVFSVRHNPFNGSELELTDSTVSTEDIRRLIQQQSELGKQLLWLTLGIHQSHLIPLFTEHGFVFHLCDECSLTLIHRIQDDAFAPFAPTHTAGVGGLVTNSAGEVLLIRDRWMKGKGLKLPGGYIDLGEPLHKAAEREVHEETGIKASFEGVVGIIDKHPHAYDKANLYIVCRLNALTNDIQILDEEEIELAEWVDPDWFINDDKSPHFHRHLVKTLRNAPCLQDAGFEFADLSSRKVMYIGK